MLLNIADKMNDDPVQFLHSFFPRIFLLFVILHADLLLLSYSIDPIKKLSTNSSLVSIFTNLLILLIVTISQ